MDDMGNQTDTSMKMDQYTNPDSHHSNQVIQTLVQAGSRRRREKTSKFDSCLCHLTVASCVLRLMVSPG